MKFFHWKDSFNIGIDELDRQHRSFLEMLNEYYDSATGCTKDIIGEQLIVKIKDYAAMHFRFEEQLMKDAGYTETAHQQEQHLYFESLVSNLASHHTDGQTEDLKNFLSLLKDWFLCHILEEDKKFVPHMKP